MEFEPAHIASLRATFDSAVGFGLRQEEVWQTLDDCLELTGNEATMAEYLDEVTEALSRRILFKQRILNR